MRQHFETLDDAIEYVKKKLGRWIKKKLSDGGVSTLDEDPCGAIQSAYDSIVLSIAQKLMTWQQKDADADAAWDDYQDEIAAGIIVAQELWNCRNPP